MASGSSSAGRGRTGRTRAQAAASPVNRRLNSRLARLIRRVADPQTGSISPVAGNRSAVADLNRSRQARRRAARG